MHKLNSISLLFLNLASTSLARDITFPAVYGAQNVLKQGRLDDVDLDVPNFYGLTTFANLPYVNCLKESAILAQEKYDIVFMGAPFDTVRYNLF
jgi:agmatinase